MVTLLLTISSVAPRLSTTIPSIVIEYGVVKSVRSLGFAQPPTASWNESTEPTLE
jgi:hypothetical protein